MPFYRLYLLDRNGAIAAREEFRAADDEAAVEICGVVTDACSELYAGYEIWNLSRFVSKVRDVSLKQSALPLPALEEIRRTRQESILGVEDSIHRSRWRVVQSRRLIERTHALRTILGEGPRAA